MYLKGAGVKQDAAAGEKLIREAAEHGSEEAKAYLKELSGK